MKDILIGGGITALLTIVYLLGHRQGRKESRG